jgi:hypothetical protein
LAPADRAFVFLVFVFFLDDAGNSWGSLRLDDAAGSTLCACSVDWWLDGWTRGWRGSAGRTFDVFVVDEVVHLGILLLRIFFILFFYRVHLVVISVGNYALGVRASAASLAVCEVSTHRESSSLRRNATFQKPAHHERSLIGHVVLPVFVIHILHLHLAVQFFGVVLGHFVHIAEACEAVAPRYLARLVEYESALLAASVFELPCAHRAPVDAIFLVSEDLQWRASCM